MQLLIENDVLAIIFHCITYITIILAQFAEFFCILDFNSCTKMQKSLLEKLYNFVQMKP